MNKAFASKRIQHFRFCLFSIAILLSFVTLLSPAIARATPIKSEGYIKYLAADTTDGPKVDCNIDQSSANCGITRYILLFINVLSATLGIVVTISIIIAGIQYSASAGDPQATANAKKRISNAILALVTFAFMYGFLQWIVPGGLL